MTQSMSSTLPLKQQITTKTMRSSSISESLYLAHLSPLLQGFNVFMFEIEDASDANIAEHFETAFRFINEGLNLSKRVLGPSSPPNPIPFPSLFQLPQIYVSSPRYGVFLSL